MRKNKPIILLFIALLTFSLLAGCNNAKKYESKTETPQVVVDENKKPIQYVTDQQPDVVKVKQLATDYTKAYSNRDYKTTTGDEESTYLSKNLVQKRNDANYKKTVVDFYKKYEVVSKFQDLTISKIEFNKDFTTATVTGIAKIQYINANDKLLKAYKMQKNSTGERGINLSLVKESGNWKVDSTSSSNIKVKK